MYDEALSWYLKRWIGTSPREARRHDLARLFRAPDLDRGFPPDGLREAVEAPCHRMKIDPRAGGRIRVDDEPRPNKAPRAFVATPRIPDEVILVVRPSGGPDTTRRICTSWAMRFTSPTSTRAPSSIGAWAIPR
jgi:hypothetical protein